MRSLVDRVRMAREGSQVLRCHTVPHHGEYSVGLHSWGVAMLCLQLWPDRPQLLPLALAHDLAERWTGDIPAPAKWAMGDGMADEMDDLERRIHDQFSIPHKDHLEPDDYARLKAADYLELYLWALEQDGLGNRHTKGIIHQVERYFNSAPLPTPADDLYYQISHRGWERHNEDFKQ